MKVLWLCNLMMPVIAEQLNMEASNKEGWISGLADVVLKKGYENGVELAVAFPAPEELFPEGHQIVMRTISVSGGKLTCYGFREDTVNPEVYDEGLEEIMKKILDSWQPEIVHCFGTEYPHTLAMCRVFPKKTHLLISVQGLCSVCADAYFASLPESVVNSRTFRDRVKQDNLRQQQEKFAVRGDHEIEALKLAANVTGRTEWDRFYTRKWNPEANYYNMNETLRPVFYGSRWNKEQCVPHSIFLSQGDYPIKGLHYMLKALPKILKAYPDTKVWVAGNSIVKYTTLKQKLKISGYGKYLHKMMADRKLLHKVRFLGKLSGEKMKETYLKSNLFVCCSSVENSPNSLGEAMILGVPCVAADVGGIPSIFTGGEDGILFPGFRSAGEEFNNNRNSKKSDGEQYESIADALADAVLQMWSDENRMEEYCGNARNHAERTHHRERNYRKLTEIYTKIIIQ